MIEMFVVLYIKRQSIAFEVHVYNLLLVTLSETFDQQTCQFISSKDKNGKKYEPFVLKSFIGLFLGICTLTRSKTSFFAFVNFNSLLNFCPQGHQHHLEQGKSRKGNK